MKLATLDFFIFIVYAIGLLCIALWISRNDKKEGTNTEDYFLASKALPWWAIGASLIASNISAEQIIGMSGSGFALGMGIASYELMAALTLVLVGKYLLPVFLKNNIYTMPQYLEQRFDTRVKTVMATFWLAVYIFVNLTSVLWLGGLAFESVAGVDAMFGMIFLAIFSIAYSLYGGLKAVAYTDILQVVLLVFGGLLLSYLALDAVSDGQGFIAGFGVLTEKLPGHFDMILSEENSQYINLPGISVLVGGLWVTNLAYWGFNQYIIQRALAASNIKEAQKGIVFAAYLKLLMPIIVVVPGIAAVILYPEIEKNDLAYPALMDLMPVGIKGLIFAALVAAIVSSLASMTNSISTIFTMDIYSKAVKNKSQRHYVHIGRITSLVALSIGLLTAEPLLGKFDQAFQYIQEFTGLFTPGIVVIFITGMFWKRTTANAALAAGVGSAVFSVLIKVMAPEYPFMDRMGIVLLLCFGVTILMSLMSKSEQNNTCVNLSEVNFETSKGFNIASLGVVIILCIIYTVWW
ncbi:sodium/sugar symporter [Algibacillus agarilyticus]|uniref:sodium/sugar symporter n=1 Tax=Algibacillus agarilyticus TaxID=2234133 RepID=UPI000DD0BDAF|nr:sodium/sugar symporter [Algibacillus agarilyticus]